MIIPNSILVLEGSAGSYFPYYVRECVKFCKERFIKNCIITFNGWHYKLEVNEINSDEDIINLNKIYSSYLKAISEIIKEKE